MTMTARILIFKPEITAFLFEKQKRRGPRMERGGVRGWGGAGEEEGSGTKVAQRPRSAGAGWSRYENVHVAGGGGIVLH
jgi:hypothetical protein